MKHELEIAIREVKSLSQDATFVGGITKGEAKTILEIHAKLQKNPRTPKGETTCL